MTMNDEQKIASRRWFLQQCGVGMGGLAFHTLMGRAASMNQVAVFVGLLFWSWVWGVWGMLLAVPMMMVIKVICDHVEPLQPVGHLLGE